MSYHITKFELPVKLDDFCSIFWHEKVWYEDFMENTLKDINVAIGEWKENEDNSLVRHIKSDHPSKVSFPGLPSHATSIKIQKMIMNSEAKSLTIIESNNFDGIPYSDYFRVDTVWLVEEAIAMIMGSSETCTRVSITGEVVFVKSTWLRGSIESNTKAELQTVYASWELEAARHIKSRFRLADMTTGPPEVVTNVQMPPFYETDLPQTRLSRANSSISILSSDDERFYDCEEGCEGDGPDSGGSTSDTYALLSDVRIRQERMRLDNSCGLYSTPTLAPRRRSTRYRNADDNFDGDEYDCELGHSGEDSGDDSSGTSQGRTRPRNGYAADPSPMHLLTPKELMELYGKSSGGFSGSESVGVPQSFGLHPDRQGSWTAAGSSQPNEDKPISRMLVVTLAEVIYVLAESSFWQVYLRGCML